MGVDITQLQQAFGISKQYSDTELSEAEKRISALLQALYEVIQGNYKDPFQIEDGVGIQDTPVGHIMAFMGTKVPRHYLPCDGSVLNIADFPALAQHMIDQFETVNHFGGDGTTTFAVPDLRGEFLRGAGTNSHADQGNGSSVGEHQDATRHPYMICHQNGNIDYTQNSYSANEDSVLNRSNGATRWVCPQGSSSGVRTYNYMARPTNTSVLYCIKYEPTFYLKVGPDAMIFHEGETRIGTWYDGKPLYRKFVTTPPSGVGATDVLVECKIPNLDKIVHIGGYCYNSKDRWATDMGYVNLNGSVGMTCWYDYPSQTIHFQHTGSYANQPGYDVAELWYTKTETT